MNNSFPEFRIWRPVSKSFVYRDISRQYYAQLISDMLRDFPYTQDLVFQRKSSFVDNTGKSIFEGDIVTILEDHNLNILKYGLANRKVQNYSGVRAYELDIEGFYFENMYDKQPYYNLNKKVLGYSELKYTKIIGNILENPELVK